MYKKDFPIFQTHPDLTFLDSASSTQKPERVISGISEFLKTSYSNIHRGAYDLSMESSLLYDQAKSAVAKKLSARADEIVFTYNATYAVNYLAHSLVKSGLLQKGDQILLSKVDHHANIVPWQIIADQYGIEIDWVDIHTDGTLDYDSLAQKLPWKKLLAITGASNVTGEVLDLERVKTIFDNLNFRHSDEERIHTSEKGNTRSFVPQDDGLKSPLFLLDGSQRFPHIMTNVMKYGIDFFIGTGHKVMSDTGIGFFYGRKDILRTLDPAFCGGGAINRVSIDGYESAGLPFRHEPGTPHIVGAVSLLRSLEYIDSIGGFEAIESYEKELTEYALERFVTLPPHIHLLGSKTSENRLGVFSFVFDHHHPHDVAEVLADQGICVRAGHHCTEPLHNALGIPASLRVSLYIYNTEEDIERFMEIIKTIK
jgi:cysteine desulfurase/selenocysteine lyase